MSTPPNLDIYVPSRPSGRDSFVLFSLLPTEIRLQIWRYSLQRHRIITLSLELSVELVQESSRHPVRAVDYRVCVEGYQVHSKFLRVSTEARQAAKEFYRIHLPCKFSKDPSQTTRKSRGAEPGTYEWRAEASQPGTLYVNPEHDFLRISTEPTGLDSVLVDFLCQLKTVRDPRRIGLLNLALDEKELSALVKTMERERHDTALQERLLTTLGQLNEVFFVGHAPLGRLIPTLITFNRAVLNRSFPLMSKTPSFERLARDPRDIAPDLKRLVAASCTTRGVFQDWMGLPGLRALAPKTKFRLLLSARPHSPDQNGIYDRETAVASLRKEHEMWEGPDFRGGKWNAKTGSEEIRSETGCYPGGESPQAVQTAIGFWLFPIEVLDDAFPCAWRYHHDKVDASGHWPELAVAAIS